MEKQAAVALLVGLVSFKLWRALSARRSSSASAEVKRDLHVAEVRLTKLVKAAGCAAKLSPVVLREATRDLRGTADPRLLVGFEWADDAGVVEFDATRALVQTVDFFTPIVDDAYAFGSISAANALSDVYAMGGEPICGVNVVGFPDGLDASILHQVLQGGLDKLREAGAVLAGGHSVRDPELKFGVAVTGVVHPDRVWRNGGAVPTDVIVLTKAIGTGVLTTARKRDVIGKDDMTDAIASMQRLNRDAKQVADKFIVHACTDITGNGLAGHLWEMARASSCDIEIEGPAVPVFRNVRKLVLLGNSPGGCKTPECRCDTIRGSWCSTRSSPAGSIRPGC